MYIRIHSIGVPFKRRTAPDPATSPFELFVVVDIIRSLRMHMIAGARAAAAGWGVRNKIIK